MQEIRQYAARRAMLLGYGGDSLVSEVIGIDHKSIGRGKKDIEAGDLYISVGSIRKAGGERKTVGEVNPIKRQKDHQA